MPAPPSRFVGGTIAHQTDDDDEYRSEPGALCQALARCLRDGKPPEAKDVSSDDDDDIVLRLEVATATPPPKKAAPEPSPLSEEMSQRQRHLRALVKQASREKQAGGSGKKLWRTPQELFDSNYMLHVDRELGQGSFARVLLGTALRTGERVAIKIINRAKLKCDAHKLLQTEVRNHEKLRHPNIVRLHTWITTPHEVSLVMDYCSAGNLAQLLEARGDLSDGEARGLFEQLMCGLDFCHSLGFHHCDLKLENLMLVPFAPEAAASAVERSIEPPVSPSLVRSQGLAGDVGGLRLKITDFGLSRMTDVGALSYEACGTPLYAAPEILSPTQPTHAYDPGMADVWACGVILYALLAGSLPFDAASIAGLVQQVRAGLPAEPVPRHRGFDAAELVASLLLLRPKARPTTAEVRGHVWLREAREAAEVPAVRHLKSGGSVSFGAGLLATPPPMSKLAPGVAMAKRGFPPVAPSSAAAVANRTAVPARRPPSQTASFFNSLVQQQQQQQQQQRRRQPPRPSPLGAQPKDAPTKEASRVAQPVAAARPPQPAADAESSSDDEESFVEDLKCEAMTAYKLGELAEAEWRFRQLLGLQASRATSCVGANRETALLLNNLGATLMQRGEAREAKLIWLRAMGIVEVALEPTEPMRDHLRAKLHAADAAIVAIEAAEGKEAPALSEEEREAEEAREILEARIAAQRMLERQAAEQHERTRRPRLVAPHLIPAEGEQRSLVQRELLPGSGAKRRPVAHSMGMLSD